MPKNEKEKKKKKENEYFLGELSMTCRTVSTRTNEKKERTERW